MKVRHKQPNFVSMWMLDLFCCALGCVTFLWLLNSRQAVDQTAMAKTALQDLQKTRHDLSSAESARLKIHSDYEQTTARLAATQLERDRLSDQFAAVGREKDKLAEQLRTVKAEKEESSRKLALAQAEGKAAEELLDDTRNKLASAKAKLESSAKELSSTSAKVEEAEDLLRKKQKNADELARHLAEKAATAETLAKSLTDKTTAADDLAKLLRKKEAEHASVAKLATDLQTRIDDLDARLRAARRAAEEAETAAKSAQAQGEKTAKAATSETKDLAVKLDQARATIADLQKEVTKFTEARHTIIDLQGEKAKLADKVNKMQRQTEAKFAGIALTGRRVVFVVDKSGSMDRTDESTITPTKWPTVAETVAKVMRSLPELEQFQVLVFSKEARWLFGNGEWKPFAGEKSALEVKDALLKVKVEGDTNLYSAFELAFALRDRGMDTVYLFSDGLPTSGLGLSEAQKRQNPPLRETEKSEILSRHLRHQLSVAWNRSAAGRPKVKINAVGFFYESPDVGAFLWALSRENDGSFVGMSRP